MEDIIGILLYNGFIELAGSNQTFEEKRGHFKLPRARQAGRKEHTTYCIASEDLRKFKGNQKKTASMCEITLHKRHFCYFASE